MRGGLIRSLISRAREMETVVMHCRSTSRCTRPTVWLQIPQAGVKMAISTSSLFSRAANSGAVLLVSWCK